MTSDSSGASDPSSKASIWERVQTARHLQRPYMLDYLATCFSDFVELCGDRHFGDDQAMPGGFATIGKYRCVVIGHQKGRDTKENLKRNFGCANPEGYRKALRLMRLAERFQLPVVSLIDTPGAYPGVGSEERNIAEAIAYNLREMALLKTPIVAVILGEGGSGGALGVGVADRVLMMENAYYSVISPEGCAAILWKDRKHAQDAALAMKPDAESIERLSVIDGVIPEPQGGAHTDPAAAADLLQAEIIRSLDKLSALGIEDLLAARYEKFRAMGEFTDASAVSPAPVTEDSAMESPSTETTPAKESASEQIDPDPLGGATPSTA
ncbi:MAG: acetyl-CoA carboxylase carboxyltransferase subunit alpha [Verrucomicrobiota bacterium]